MKHAILSVILTALFLTPALAQQDTFCPDVKIVPVSAISSGQPLTFAASFGSRNPDEKLKFKWKISAGVITDGQGTSKITVATDRLSDVEITAVVEIKGFPKRCAKKFSGKAFVRKSSNGNAFDHSKNLNLTDNVAESDVISMIFRNEPDSSFIFR